MNSPSIAFTLTGVIEFVVALAVLIILHELGHFLVARLLKVEVEEFGIGFPPRILTLFKAGGTTFTLNAIPLGGFTRPKGENDPDVPGGLAAASPWVRLGVLFAGAFMNLALGVLLFAIIFALIGNVPVTNRVEVLGISPDSPAAVAGLQEGDIITRINDRKITSTDLLRRVVNANLDRPLTLFLQRGDQTLSVNLTPRSNPPAGQGAIGILMGNPTTQVTWYNMIPAGGMAVYTQGKMLLELPMRLLQGTAAPEEGRLVGLKGMFDMYQFVRQTESSAGVPAVANILYFFASITVSLGILNLFPFPALDGGRIIFVLPEIILRRRVPAEYENMIHLVGLGILLLFFLYINLQDFINPLVLPKLPYP